MDRRRWIGPGLGVVAVGVISMLGAQRSLDVPGVLAAQTYGVQVGADISGGTTSANAFFPSVVTVTVGDTVSWTFPSVEPHTVTFDNGHPSASIVPGPGPGELDGSAIFLPLPLGPNPPTAFDPKVQISTGVSNDPPDQRMPFTLTFSAPGIYAYNCAIHGPDMAGTVVVLPAGAAGVETPAQATARGQGQLAAATDGAAGGLAILQPGSLALASGSTLYAVTAGDQPTAGISLLQFAPNTLTVHKGDAVTFTVPDPLEFHTVTFLSGGAEPDFLDVRLNPMGPPSFVIPANVAGPAGGNSYTGTGYLNSGIINPGNSFTVTIDAPPGTYEFRCLIHDGDPQNMKGTITVTQ